MNIDLKSAFFGALLGGVFVAAVLSLMAPKSDGNQAYGVKQGVILKGGPYFNEQEQVLNAFVEAFVEGNAEDCSELYSEDTIYMIPETPVLEGRDASTKILPNSDVKFYFICNLNIAAKRRYKELKKKTNKIKLKEVKRAINKRNIMDMNRKISPLQKHDDAIVVNTGKLNKQEMVAKMSKYVETALMAKYGK